MAEICKKIKITEEEIEELKKWKSKLESSILK